MSFPTFRATEGRIHLANISAALRSQKNQKRIGRGDGSKRGGTSGRGNKGQKARAGNGKPKPGFEGGQTSIFKRFPKRGFSNYGARMWAPVNLDRLQHWIDQGRISSSRENPITARELLLSGCVHNVHDGIKLLGDGSEHLRSEIHITPSRASQSAIEAIERLGGTVFCKHYNVLALRDCVKGRTDRIAAAPTRKQDIGWYTNWRNRGYLSPVALTKMPVVEDKWKALSQELLKFKKERFEVKLTR
ncbi:ribosomal protein L15 [Rickenella mellea]|uniref:Ribosomal protein L15 n=1 Tax=Rickenella mellea TaxID=50990 RepID=A0A4Y7QCA2_9AGAM|nr:ribosomal protein L15 [Rickenella mellea]